MDKKRKRFPIISFSSAVLVSMVVLMVTIGIISNQRKNTSDLNNKHITLSRKALLDICHGLDYADTCAQNVPFKFFNRDHKPGEFMRMGLEAAMNNLRGAAQKAISLQGENSDPHTKNALTGCSQLADKAINDLQRSLQHFLNHDIGSLGDILDDLLVWVSGALTYQHTCLDGLLHADGKPVGPIRENMRMALAQGMELTTNALGMTTRLASRFDGSGDDQTPGSGSGSAPTDQDTAAAATNRRLKSLERFPEGLDAKRRALLDGSPPNIKADVVVAQDGSGKYKTINEALKDIPLNGDKPFVLYIKAGVYNEKVTFNIAMTHLMVIGDGPTKTKITGAQNVLDGTTTFLSATVAVEGDFFIAKDIGFENTAGAAKNQAVALRVGADKVIFHNCQIDGYQDTLYTHTYRQFYRDCVISGTIDFIFGDSAAVFQNCTFLVRKPEVGQASVVMAQSRVNVRQPTGVVLQNCTIIEDASLKADKATVEVYLGRPWTEFSRTIIMESFIGDLIRAEGYTLWNGTYGLNTLYYSEYNNRGPGAAKDKRVKWQGIKELSADQVERFTPNKFIQGDLWIPPSKIPYVPGFVFPPDPKKKPAPGAPSPTGNEDVPFQNIKNCYASQAKFAGNACT